MEASHPVRLDPFPGVVAASDHKPFIINRLCLLRRSSDRGTSGAAFRLARRRILASSERSAPQLRSSTPGMLFVFLHWPDEEAVEDIPIVLIPHNTGAPFAPVRCPDPV